MANAYTTGKRDRMDPVQKAKIRAAFAADKLEDFLKGKTELNPAHVSAAKALMDKGMPSLQAVESVQTNDFEKMSEDELESMVKALITSHPALIQKLGIGLRPVQDHQEAPQQPADTASKAA